MNAFEGDTARPPTKPQHQNMTQHQSYSTFFTMPFFSLALPILGIVYYKIQISKDQNLMAEWLAGLLTM